MAILQLFCTVSDLIADKQASGVDEARMFQAIREASDFLQKEIGWFIPVTLERKFNGRGLETLIVPALLSVTEIVDDDNELEATDYILKPDDGFWPNGPYGKLIVAPEAENLLAWCDEENGVEITGLWGLYLRSGLIGATVADTTEQSDSQTTLKVSDGSRVSPGMVLLIGSEQEAVTGWGSPTTGATTLNGNVAAADETIVVTNGALINVGEIIRVDFEQMKVKDKNTHTLEVARGWNGTRRVSHTTSTNVDVYRTVNVERGLNGTTAAAHANAVAISRYFAPDDVQFLCKEIATLIVNKALSGYQGRTGDQQTGVVFYNDAFPQYDIARVKANYIMPRVY